MSIFQAADLLIPHEAALPDWAVIACDQFSSQPEYWRAVRAQTEGKPSAYHIVFPEAELGRDEEERIFSINAAMRSYLDAGLFRSFPASCVYVERQLLDGSVRRGVVGVIDLEETYNEERDYSYKTYALVGLILTKIEMLKATKNPSPQNTLVLLGLDLKDHLKRFEHDAEGAFLDAYQIAYPRRNVYPTTPTEAEVMVSDLTKFLYSHDPIRSSEQDPSWDDVEAEARKIGQDKPDDDRIGEIDSGLLNDLDDGSDGMAPAEEVIGHDD